MKKNILLLLCIIMQVCQAQQKPISIIFDTDMGPDYDDVGAITLLHAFADSGQATILATMASTKYEGVAAVLNVLNTYFNRPSIPIGVPKDSAVMQKDWQHWTDTLIAHYPHTIQQNSEVPDAVKLYRQLLSQQPDHSVTIVTVGFLTNLSNLLRTGPDNYSSLKGYDLVKKKVKQLVCMAGKFPEGNEFNVKEDAKASQTVFGGWPTPVILSGFEIGQKIKTGLPLINNTAIQHSPVKDVFRLAIPMAKEDSAGRMSWDETAVLVAVKGYQPFYTLQSGKMIVAVNGTNTWNNKARGHHYLVEAKPPSEVQDLINTLMLHQPMLKDK